MNEEHLKNNFDGFVLCDKRGLDIESYVMPQQCSGFSTSIIECSKILTNNEQCVITIEGNNGTLFITEENEFILTALKK